MDNHTVADQTSSEDHSSSVLTLLSTAAPGIWTLPKEWNSPNEFSKSLKHISIQVIELKDCLPHFESKNI